MDELDKKILYELETNSRQSITQIAKKVSTHKSVAAYRIQRLVDSQIILHYKYISNAFLLGKQSYGVFIQFADISKKQERDFFHALKKITPVHWAKPISNKWDCLIVIVTESIQQFSNILQKIILQSNKIIKTYEFYIEKEGHVFNHKYLQPKNATPIQTTYALKNKIELDSITQNTYEILKQDAKTPLLEIAQTLHTNYNTIKRKTDWLIQNHILLRPTVEIDCTTLGYEESLVVCSVSPEQVANIITYAKNHTQIIRISECLGRFNLMLTVHTTNYQNLNDIIKKLRNTFANSIHSYEIFQVIN